MLSKKEYIKKYGDFILRTPEQKNANYKWVDPVKVIFGNVDITFDDGETIYSLWSDFPRNFTQEQIDAFMSVDDYWQNRFRSRLKD